MDSPTTFTVVAFETASLGVTFTSVFRSGVPPSFDATDTTKIYWYWFSLSLASQFLVSTITSGATTLTRVQIIGVVGGGSGLTNPLSSDLAAAGNDITNIGLLSSDSLAVNTGGITNNGELDMNQTPGRIFMRSPDNTEWELSITDVGAWQIIAP
jgi:hypothetical protein